MNMVSDLHREAMALADQSLAERLRGKVDRANELIRDAFEKERQAASLVALDLNQNQHGRCYTEALLPSPWSAAKFEKRKN